MSNELIYDDASRLSKLDRWLFRLEKWQNLLAGLLILGIVFGSMANIVGRGLFNKPFMGYFDLMAQSVPLIAFLGIAYCARLGGHVRLDLLLGKLKGRSLWAVESVLTLLMLIITLVLSYGSWLHTLRAYSIGDSTEDAGLPVWPVKFLIFMIFVMLALRLTLQLCSYVKAFINNESKPSGVPMILSIEEQAKQHAN